MVLKLNDEGLYQCPFEGCQKAYKPRQSLVSHIKNKHQQKPKENENENMFDDNSQVEKALADAVEEQELIENMQEQLINFEEVDMSRYLVATPVAEEDSEFDDEVALGASEMLRSLRTQDLRVSLDLLLEKEPQVFEVEKTVIEENAGLHQIEELVICGECTYLFKTEAEAEEHMKVKHGEEKCGDCGVYSDMIKKIGVRMRKMATEKRNRVAEIKELRKQLEETKVIMEDSLEQVHRLTVENDGLKMLDRATKESNEENSDEAEENDEVADENNEAGEENNEVGVENNEVVVQVQAVPEKDPELVRKGAALLNRSSAYPVSCNKCNFTCVMVDNLFNHMKRAHKGIIEVDEFGCDQCDESPSSRTELMNHIVEEHSSPVEVIEKVKCSRCVMEFTSSAEMKKHKCSMHPLHAKWTCSFCKLEFKGNDARDKHVCFKHPFQSVEVQRKRIYRATTECKWGSNCRRMARNTCWFKHSEEESSPPQEVQVEELQEEEEQGWQVQSRRQGGRNETRYCSFQENCNRRDTCRFKHIDSLNYLSSTIQENY